MIDRFSICLAVIVFSFAPVSVCSVSSVAVTVTISDCAPTSRVKSNPRESLALSMSHYLVRQIEATPNIAVRARTEVVDGGGIGWLDHLVLRDHTTGCDEPVPAAGLVIMIGADPGTDWLPDELRRDEAGFVLTGADIGPNRGWPHERRPFLLETSMPGVFAVGDVRHGAGRRVAASVGG